MLRYEQRLRREVACPILGTPRDFLYPYRLFSDTVHHLNSAGKRIRIERLARLLEGVPVISAGSGAGRAAGGAGTVAGEADP